MFFACTGRKAEKKVLKKKLDQDEASARKRNPKAFAINSVVNAQRRFRRLVKQNVFSAKNSNYKTMNTFNMC
jgi:hypothetical protein